MTYIDDPDEIHQMLAYHLAVRFHDWNVCEGGHFAFETARLTDGRLIRIGYYNYRGQLRQDLDRADNSELDRYVTYLEIVDEDEGRPKGRSADDYLRMCEEEPDEADRLTRGD